MKNEPAFPIITLDDFRDLPETNVKQTGGGLTKLEYFAGLAMQASRSRNSNYKNWEELAKDSVDIAKALIAELERQND